MVSIETVDERITVRINIPIVGAVVRRPSSEEEPVEFGYNAWRDRVGRGVVAVVVQDHVGEGVVLEDHVPVVGRVGSVELAVGRAIEGAAVVHGVVRRVESVRCIVINNTAISIVGVVEVGNTVVVIVPVNAVLKTIAVNIGVHVVGTVVSVQTTVDLMEVVVVVKVAIPVDIEHVDDTVVIVINVVPVADTVTVPVVELGERGATSLTARVWIDGVGVGLGWAVPCGNGRCCVKWE